MMDQKARLNDVSNKIVTVQLDIAWTDIRMISVINIHLIHDRVHAVLINLMDLKWYITFMSSWCAPVALPVVLLARPQCEAKNCGELHMSLMRPE